MRHWLLLLVIPSLLFSQSKLSFKNLNMGQIKAGSTMDTSITIINTGNDTLIISNVLNQFPVWSAANSGLTNEYVNALAVSPNGAGGTNLFAGTYGGGVFLSTDNGASWVAVNSGLTNTFVNALAIVGTIVFAGTDNGAFLSVNNGAAWTPVNDSLSNVQINSFAAAGNYLFTGTGGKGVYASTGNGGVWTPVNNGLPDTRIYSLAVESNTLFAGDSGKIFLSANNGTAWTVSDSGLTNMVTALAVGPNGAGGTNIFAGTHGEGVFLSTDNGTSWTPVDSGLTYLNIKTLYSNGSDLFAGTNGSGVFYSGNNGTYWSAVDSGLASTYFTSFAVSGTDLFTGTNGGVFRSHYVKFAAGISPAVIPPGSSGSLKIHFDAIPAGGISEKIVIGSNAPSSQDTVYITGNGITTSVENTFSGIPTRITLSQNYPNPFNPSTNIDYQVPARAYITMKVYNVMGQEVAILKEGEQEAGSYSVEFDAKNLPSGVYFARLLSNGVSLVRKLVLMK
jgi:hypothetical protein